jgi:hypothetical protein
VWRRISLEMAEADAWLSRIMALVSAELCFLSDRQSTRWRSCLKPIALSKKPCLQPPLGDEVVLPVFIRKDKGCRTVVGGLDQGGGSAPDLGLGTRVRDLAMGNNSFLHSSGPESQEFVMQVALEIPLEVKGRELHVFIKEVSESLIVKLATCLPRNLVGLVRLFPQGKKGGKVVIQGSPKFLWLSHGSGRGGNEVGFQADLDHAVRGNSMWSRWQNTESSDRREKQVVTDSKVPPVAALGSGCEAGRLAGRGAPLGRTGTQI